MAHTPGKGPKPSARPDLPGASTTPALAKGKPGKPSLPAFAHPAINEGRPAKRPLKVPKPY